MANRTVRTPAGGRDYSQPAGKDYSRSQEVDSARTPGTDYGQAPAKRRVAKERVVRERRVVDRSCGLVLAGLGILFAGAWGGIAPYIGPLFGYKFSNLSSFQWTEPNALLRLAPGAVCVLAGLVLLIGGARLGGTRAGPWFWGLITVLCGAWFVIGPAAWQLLGHANPILPGLPYSTGTFLNRVGAQLGVGVVLAYFGANAMGLVPRMSRTVRD